MKYRSYQHVYHECHSAWKKSNYCHTIHITDSQCCQEKTTDPWNSRHSVCLMGELSEAWIYDVIHREAKNNGFYFASLLLAESYESCRTGNDVVSRYIFAPVCRPVRTTLQYSLFKCRPQSFQLEEVRCYSFTTFQWSSKSFQIPAIELLVQSNLKAKIQFLNCENFVLSKFSNKKSLTIKIFFEKKYMTFFCFVSFVFLVKILKILLEILILFNFKIILLFKILTKKTKDIYINI